MMNEPLDKVGNLITVGSIIVHGYEYGQRNMLRIGKVLSIRAPKPLVYEPKYSPARPWGITVIAVQDGFAQLRLYDRPGTLQFPERMTVLNENQIPAPYKALLDGYVP